MEEIRITRKLDGGKVRELCISYRLFTWGNNEEYSDMFNQIGRARTDADILAVAETIWEHSDTEFLETEGFDFKSLCWYLFNRCVITYIE